MPEDSQKTAPVIQLVLTDKPTEAGEAVALLDGCPHYTIDGEPLALKYPDLRAAHALANTEAKTRREALEKVAKAVGLDVDIRNSPGIEAVLGRLDSWSGEQAELTGLRASKEAGALDDTADEKIRERATTLRVEEFDQLHAAHELTKSKLIQETTAKEAALKNLAETHTVTALRHHYDEADGFAPGALKVWLAMAQQTQSDGARWRPSGDVSPEGIASLALTDEHGTVRKGTDGVSALSLKAWAEGTFKAANPILFKHPNGGPPGVNPAAGPGEVLDSSKMQPREIDAAARAAALVLPRG